MNLMQYTSFLVIEGYLRLNKHDLG